MTTPDPRWSLADTHCVWCGRKARHPAVHPCEANGSRAVALSLRATVEALEVEVADLRKQEELQGDDILRLLSERNEVARVAAGYIRPGPDGQDDLDREELIREWIDMGREEAADFHERWVEATTRWARAQVQLEAQGKVIERAREIARRIKVSQDFSDYMVLIQDLLDLLSPSGEVVNEEAGDG